MKRIVLMMGLVFDKNEARCALSEIYSTKPSKTRLNLYGVRFTAQILQFIKIFLCWFMKTVN